MKQKYKIIGIALSKDMIKKLDETKYNRYIKTPFKNLLN